MSSRITNICIRLGLAFAVLAIVLSGELRAADAVNEPSVIDRRLLEHTDDALQDAPDDPQLPSIVPYAQPEGEVFTLTGVTVTGSTVFAGADLAPLYEDYMATEVSQADLMAIADAATAYYHEHGYTLSRAYIPPQSIVAGVIELNIVEGYVEEVLVSGEAGGVNISPYTQRILNERPLTQSTLERNLLLMHDLGGVEVTDIALAEAVEGSGAYTLGLQTTYAPIEGSLYLDNRGTRAVGQLQLGVSGTLNSLLGSGEALTASVYTSPNDFNELQFAQLNWTQPIGSDGLALSLTGSHSRTKPGASLAAFGREGNSVYGRLGFQYPLRRMRNETLWLRGGFDIRNGSDKTDLGIIFDDRLRVARIKVDYFHVDEWNGTNFVSVGLAQGFDILGASGAGHRWASRWDGEVQFTKLIAEYYRYQRLWSDELALALRISAQKSSAPLLSAEEFGLGGGRFGRAYEYGELTGDDGVAGALELQYRPDIATPIADEFTLFGFYDIGAVWNRHTPVDRRRASLASAGAGIRFRLLGQLNASVEGGKPLTRDTGRSGSREPQLYFSLFSAF